MTQTGGGTGLICAEGSRQGWWRRLGRVSRTHWPTLFGAVVASFLGGLAASAGPLVQKVIVDDVIVDHTRSLSLWLGLLIFVGLVTMVLTMVRRLLGNRFSLAVQQDLGVAVYEHANRLDTRTRQELQPGDVFSRATVDIRLLNAVLGRLHAMVGHVVHLATVLVAMLWLSTPLALLMAAFIPMFAALAWRMRARLFPATWHGQRILAATTAIVAEAASGIRVVKAFGQAGREGDRYREASRHLFRSRLRTFRLNAIYGSALESLPGLGQVLLVAVGGLLAINGHVTLGTFVAFASYVTQLLNPVRSLTRFFASSQQARAGAERVLAFIDTPIQIEDPAPVPIARAACGLVEFDGVSFGYMPGRVVVRNLSLRIEPGECVGFVGPSGSGKSTLARLLVRMYDVDEGTVRLDGQDVRDFGLVNLRRQVGGVIDTPYIFSATIADNVAVGSPGATFAEIKRAAAIAGAADFVEQLPDEYATLVGEKGVTLSGGQRQRLALARAVLADRPVMILDEATSAVDALTEEEIHRSLRAALGERTTIVIANRRSTLRLVDRIVVLDGGTVVAEGSVSSLLEKSAVFRSIWGMAQTTSSTDGHVPARSGTTSVVANVEHLAREHARRIPTATDTARMLSAIKGLPPLEGEPDLQLVEAETEPGFDLRMIVGSFRRPVLGGLALVLLASVLSLIGPLALRYATDEGILTGTGTAVLHAAGVLLATVVVGWAVAWATSLHTSRTAERMLFVIRVRTFRHLQDLPIGFFDRETTGRIIARLTADVEALGSLLQQGLIGTAVSSLTAVGAFILLFVLNWRLALGVSAVLVPLCILTARFRSRATQAHAETRHALSTMYSELSEGIDAVTTTQMAACEDRMVTRFTRLSAVYTAARMRTVTTASGYFPVVRWLADVASAVVLGIGAVLIDQGSLTVGLLLAFLVYVDYFFTPMQELSEQLDLWASARVSLGKIEELMAEAPETGSDQDPPTPIPDEVALHQVTFAYAGSGRPALDQVDLLVRQGETLAVVGSTGAGKSTLAKLLLGFYDPTAGAISIDGQPITALDARLLRLRIGYVQQEPVLFGVSVHDNIAYGRPQASHEEVESVARSVGIHEAITLLPDGYSTMLGPEMLSSGQRQLICLARALLIEPALLILDEATANLDLAAEGHVRDAMEQAASARTTLLIAHRLQTVTSADRIVVLEQGRIVEEGAHHDLVGHDGPYARMWSAFSTSDDEAVA